MEVEHLFEEATVKANTQSAAVPSGLHYSHRQAALCDETVKEIAEFTLLVFSSRILPKMVWILHTSANLSALGKNVRPVACGDVLQRAFGAVSAVDTAINSLTIFIPGVVQFVVSGGVETVD